MKSSDKATLEYLNILNDRGVDAIGYIAENLGVSKGDVYDMISKGQLSGVEVSELIIQKFDELYACLLYTSIDGMAASAATMPLFAADEIIAPEGSLTMMHDPWTITIGNAIDLRKTAETMEKLEESYAEIYESRLKSGAQINVRQKMHDEWWLNGKELAELFENVSIEETKAAACASAMFKNYKKMPKNATTAREKEKLMLIIEAM